MLVETFVLNPLVQGHRRAIFQALGPRVNPDEAGNRRPRQFGHPVRIHLAVINPVIQQHTAQREGVNGVIGDHDRHGGEGAFPPTRADPPALLQPLPQAE